jgi:hypothetical protein
VPERAFPVFDELASEVLFRGESVMCRAAQREIRHAVLAARGKRFQVVKLETMRLGATRSVSVKVATAIAVALEDGAADGGGDVTPAPARVRLFGSSVEGVGGLGMLFERVRARQLGISLERIRVFAACSRSAPQQDLGRFRLAASRG